MLQQETTPILSNFNCQQETEIEEKKYSTETHIISVIHGGKTLGIILRREFEKPGIHFLTPDEFSQQLAYMKHPAGKIISPHIHNEVQREVFFTQEVLIIKKGVLRVDFYTDQQQYLESYLLRSGDVILLIRGGHGFQILEEVEMLEVKQGPYVGHQDKVRFSGIQEEQITLIQ
jgi:mannose-6-phosphate isomerase-like protein (cupin superfamily)